MIVVPVIALITVLIVFSTSRKIWDFIDTPTVSPSGAIIGQCELKGRATFYNPSRDMRQSIVSPIAKKECVWFDVLVEKYVRSGKTSHWSAIARHKYESGIWLSDEYGSVYVDVNNAERHVASTYDCEQNDTIIGIAYDHFHPNQRLASQGWKVSPDGYYLWHDRLQRWLLSSYVSSDGSQFYDQTAKTWVALNDPSIFNQIASALTSTFFKGDWTDQTVRVTERVIYPNEELFVHGNVSAFGETAELTVAMSNDVPFVVSNKPERDLINKYRWMRRFASVGALLSSFWFAYWNVGKLDSDPTTSSHLIKTILYVALPVFVFWIVMTFVRCHNRFVRLRQRIEMSTSTIGITQKRRSDLIPQLCDVVEELTNHENTVQTKLATLRTTGAQTKASQEISLLAESYPVLKSAENFLYLQQELARTEEIIAMSRSFYNDSVLAIDQLRTTLVGMVLSPLFSKVTYLELSE